MSAKIDPSTFTVEDILAAAERAGVVIDDCDWAFIRDDGQLCVCPLTALAIDADPTIKDVCLESSYRIQRITKLSPAFIAGMTDGFDHGPQWKPDEDEEKSRDFMQGFNLGRACLKRIKPNLFVPLEEDE